MLDMATSPGRPVEEVPREIADSIVDWISEGKTLRDFCRQPETPSFRTVYNWMEKDKGFAARIAYARDSGHEVIAQECLAIADDGSNDWQETEFGPRLNAEAVNRSKLRVWTRLQLLAKWNPKKYGEKLDLEHSGPNGGPIVVRTLNDFYATEGKK